MTSQPAPRQASQHHGQPVVAAEKRPSS